MRAQVVILGAALAGALGHAGCRAVDGLDGLRFDLPSPLDGGAGGGETCACTPPLPWGWSGPIAVYAGLPGTAPGCPGAYPTPILDGGAGLDGSPAACDACSCSGAPATCSPGLVEAHWQNACHGQTAASVTPAPGACTAFSPPCDYLMADDPPMAASGCAPSGGASTLPPLTWTTEAIACALPSQGPACTDGSRCVPDPPAPFEAQWCVWRAGAKSCPPQFPRPRAWETAGDGRGCTPCTCASTATCAVTTSLYGDSSCTVHLADVSAGQCVEQTGVNSVQATVKLVGSPSCTAGGGSPTGAAVAQPGVTICCPP